MKSIMFYCLSKKVVISWSVSRTAGRSASVLTALFILNSPETKISHALNPHKMDNDGPPNISVTEPMLRELGSTELTLCKSLPGGTGIAVIGLLFSKHHDTLTIQNILCDLQSAHPLLRSRLRHHKDTKTYSFVTMPAPYIKIQEFDPKASSSILQPGNSNSPFLQIVEHNLNEDMSCKIPSSSNTDLDVCSARFYELENGMRVLALQVLMAVMDTIAEASLMKEFLTRLATARSESVTERINTKVGLALEDMIPKKIAKGIWSTGRNLLSGAVTSIGLTNLSFKDTKSLPRNSKLIRLELDQIQTQKLLTGCASRGTKLHGALASAAMIAAHSSNAHQNDVNFGLISVFDCRSSLNPPLTAKDIGFYSTGFLTSHSVGKNASFWNLAVKIHDTFTKAKKTGNHFTNIEIGNYLFCKAIENPGLTPSSAQRTALLSMHEEPVIISKDCWKDEVGLEDMILCSSAHGAGTSITIIDNIQDGQLICTIAYPSPLHSKEQVMEVVKKMKSVLVDAVR